jgi:hypothetical protein
VAHGSVDGGARGVERGPDVGEFKEWSEWVNLHGANGIVPLLVTILTEEPGAPQAPLSAEDSQTVTPPN